MFSSSLVRPGAIRARQLLLIGKPLRGREDILVALSLSCPAYRRRVVVLLSLEPGLDLLGDVGRNPFGPQGGIVLEEVDRGFLVALVVFILPGKHFVDRRIVP